MPLTYQDYLDGIARAEEAGRIKYLRREPNPHHPGARFSHINKSPSDQGRVSMMNTRHLSPLAQEALEKVLNAKGNQVFHYLESGLGLGVAAYDVYRLAKATNKAVRISSLGQEPIDPQTALTANYAEILFKLGVQYQGFVASSSLDVLLESNSRLDPDKRCFDSLPEPYISTQYVGTFPDDFTDCQSLPQEVDFIHDDHGALYYGALHYGSPIYESLRKAVSMLTPDGVIFMNIINRGDNEDISNLLKTHPDIRRVSGHILAKTSSVLAQ